MIPVCVAVAASFPRIPFVQNHSQHPRYVFHQPLAGRRLPRLLGLETDHLPPSLVGVSPWSLTSNEPIRKHFERAARRSHETVQRRFGGAAIATFWESRRCEISVMPTEVHGPHYERLHGRCQSTAVRTRIGEWEGCGCAARPLTPARWPIGMIPCIFPQFHVG